MKSGAKRVILMGAAGRDFHNFNVVYRDDPAYQVVVFTATQIPHIEGRLYPPELAGQRYPEGIPIRPEEELEKWIRDGEVDQVVLSYSDLRDETVMRLASRALAAGADFVLLGPQSTMLTASKPVIAVCAVRTGAGKSQTSRYVAGVLRDEAKRVVVIRHPMPYGNLVKQRVQRFASMSDLDAEGTNITIEEREEYEPHVARGTIVYAGVDYAAILERAEGEAEILLWDGGNNDLPFLRPDLWITVADSHRPGHELGYYPGEANFRAADVIVINKANTAPEGGVETVRRNASLHNPRARVVVASSEVTADDPDLIRDRRVLLIEDGPTLTHGEMPYGAGKIAADKYGAKEIVDPRPFAQGSIRDVFSRYAHLGRLLPAMGYYPEQRKELEETIRRADCDSVVVATPVDLRHIVAIDKPTTRVRYDLADLDRPTLRDEVLRFLSAR